jgi:hypothetical protein
VAARLTNFAPGSIQIGFQSAQNHPAALFMSSTCTSLDPTGLATE